MVKVHQFINFHYYNILLGFKCFKVYIYGVMAGQSGQIWSPWPFQSVDLSASNTRQDSVVVICLTPQ